MKFTLQVTIEVAEYKGSDPDLPRSMIAIEILRRILRDSITFNNQIVDKTARAKDKNEINEEIGRMIVDICDANLDRIHDIEPTIKDVTIYEN